MRCGACPDPDIDELTAWLIGWNYTYQEVFKEFAPQYRMRDYGTRIRFNLKKKKQEGTTEKSD